MDPSVTWQFKTAPTERTGGRAIYVPRGKMLGGTSFPPVGQLPYLLTLPPYGFYWFMLAGARAMPSWHIPSPEPLPDLRTLVMKAGVKELLAPEVRGELERLVLPEYLAKRRWFASKGERLLGVRITGTAALPGANGAVVMIALTGLVARKLERSASYSTRPRVTVSASS